MGTIDIDTATSISNASRLLSIISPFIDDNHLRTPLQVAKGKDPEDLEEITDILTAGLGETLKINTKQPVILQAFREIVQGAVNPRTINMMKAYNVYHQLVLENFAQGIAGRLVYIVSGSSTTPDSTRVEGKNPLSYSFMTTTSILKKLETFDDSILSKVAFIFPQPVIQTLIPREDNRGLFLEDIIASESAPFIELLSEGNLMTIEDMRKRLDNTSRRSLWHYNPGMFEPKQLVADLLQKKKREEKNEEPMIITPDDMHVEKKKAWIARRILGYGMAQLLTRSYDEILASIDYFEQAGIPIFAQKTSYTADALVNHSIRFNEYLTFDFVGELLSTGKRTPRRGVNEPTALNKISGGIQRSLGTIVVPTKSSSKSKGGLELITEEGYPHILLEAESFGTRPNIITLYDALTEEEKQFILDYCSVNNIGIQRVEQRIVELKNGMDLLVYEGRRTQSKVNRYFHNQVKGKRWMLASELDGFTETLTRLREQYARDYPSDIRGSELGSSPLECAIVNIIGRMDHKHINAAIDVAIENDHSLNEEHTLLRDAEGTPLSAKRGRILHHLWNAPIGTNSVHLRLLEENGITPLDTTAYAELEIYYMMPEEYSEKPVLYTCHPDALLFLQDEKTGKISILTIDRKTNPKTPYPEPKYLTQVAGYNWILEQILTRDMGFEVEANYVVLDKNPGKRNFDPTHKNESRPQVYRRQQFSPITLFTGDDLFYQSIPETIVEMARRKQVTYIEPALLVKEKLINESQKICDDCYKSTKIVCGYTSKLIGEQPEIARRIILPKR